MMACRGGSDYVATVGAVKVAWRGGADDDMAPGGAVEVAWRGGSDEFAILGEVEVSMAGRCSRMIWHQKEQAMARATGS